MIARITGKIVEREAKAVVVEAAGLGYRVAVGSEVLSRLSVGEEVSLRTYHHFTEGGQDLYGFVDQAEQEYFELLLSVPSVGPRTARNVLDIAPPKVLAQAVATQDITLLTKVSGVGKKTAERILVELKGKLGKKQVAGPAGSIRHETVEALISIGFTPTQARQVVGKLPKAVKTVEEAVKAALKSK